MQCVEGSGSFSSKHRLANIVSAIRWCSCRARVSVRSAELYNNLLCSSPERLPLEKVQSFGLRVSERENLQEFLAQEAQPWHQ